MAKAYVTMVQRRVGLAEFGKETGARDRVARAATVLTLHEIFECEHWQAHSTARARVARVRPSQLEPTRLKTRTASVAAPGLVIWFLGVGGSLGLRV